MVDCYGWVAPGPQVAGAGQLSALPEPHQVLGKPPAMVPLAWPSDMASLSWARMVKRDRLLQLSAPCGRVGADWASVLRQTSC